MTDTPPDRLSIDQDSKFFNEAILERGIGIRFNGVEKNNASSTRRVEPQPLLERRGHHRR